jgi:hypothetical protein
VKRVRVRGCRLRIRIRVRIKDKKRGRVNLSKLATLLGSSVGWENTLIPVEVHTDESTGPHSVSSDRRRCIQVLPLLRC